MPSITALGALESVQQLFFPEMNILLVEDEPELSQIASETMEGMGHKVHVVAGVEDAMAALEDKTKELDLLIADHRLPDGWGVALCLQCRVKYPEIRVAVVSGCLTPENIELLDEYKIPYWKKPILYSKVMRELLGPPKAPPFPGDEDKS
jgi:DNA-binding NtrC family response regulator